MPPVKDKEDGEPRQRKRPGRVPVSCAECRRLKLRCDRKVPCETCIKRGCAALCPDGQLITGGKGTRQAVADVEDLKKRNEQLQSRCRALENALTVLQAAVSDEPHPLLREGENAASGSPPSTSSNSPSELHLAGPPISLRPEEEDVLDAFGTLTLGLRGDSRFFGPTSRSEYLIHAPELLNSNDVVLPRLSPDMIDEANKELDIPLISRDLPLEMLRLLPPLSKACQLCETFLEFGKFAWYPLPRKYIFDDIMSVVYHAPKENCNVSTLHSMSLLWIIYALATLFDPSTPPYAVEAHEYYLLARVALRFAPPARDTTLTAIQAMIYMTQYLEMSDCEPAHTGSHKAWMQIGQAVKLGHSVGLHVSSSRWRLDEDATLVRNRVFWQLFSQDVWTSFGFGRPPSINLDFVECEIPRVPEEASFHLWTWQYTKLLYSITTTAFAAKQPSYAKVMEIDRSVRDFPVPSSLRVRCSQAQADSPPQSPPDTALTIQRLLATHMKEATLLNLHRPYFTQALNGRPDDPLKHKYGPSVMAIFRSAWRIFYSLKCAHKNAPNVASRLGIIWSYALSASIIMCLLVTRSPSSNLGLCSLTELDRLCDLFEEAQSQSQIASNNIAVMRRLRKLAHDASNTVSEDSTHIHNELDRLGGKTHLICPTEERLMTCESRHWERTGRVRSVTDTGIGLVPRKKSADTGAAAADAGPLCEPAVQPDLIHPSIMQDMRAFDGGDVDGANGIFGGGSGSGAGGADARFNLDFPSTAFPNPQQAEFPLFPDFDFASPAGTVGTPSSASGGGSGASGMGAAAGPLPTVGDPWRHSMQAVLDPPTGVPVLDETWQALVEQLGF